MKPTARIASLLVLVALAASLAGCSHFAPRRRAERPVATDKGVRFSYFAPSATRVQLGGSWPENNWTTGDGDVGEADIGLMGDEDNDGLWEIVVPLGPGRYRYLFLVDENTWHLDPGNPEEVPGGPARTASQIVVFIRGNTLEVR